MNDFLDELMGFLLLMFGAFIGTLITIILIDDCSIKPISSKQINTSDTFQVVLNTMIMSLQ